MFLTTLLAVAIAQPGAAPLRTVSPNRWTVDYGRVSCTLARRVGGDGSPILALNAPLGLEPGELVVMETDGRLDQQLRGALEVRLDGGAPLAVRARREQRNGRPVVKLAPMPEDFLNRLAAAGELRVRRGEEEVLALALPGARAAIDELTRCNDDLMQSWGIDVAARRALRRRPRLRNSGWALEISPSADTYLVFIAQVSEQGRPLGCRIAVSSGNERMDRAVCNAMQSNARFEPALDAQDHQVPAQYVTRVRWLVGSRAD